MKKIVRTVAILLVCVLCFSMMSMTVFAETRLNNLSCYFHPDADLVVRQFITAYGTCNHGYYCLVCDENIYSEHCSFNSNRDCTSEPLCDICYYSNPYYVGAHSFGGEWYEDESCHYQLCENERCNVRNESHHLYDGDTCTVCGHVIDLDNLSLD